MTMKKETLAVLAVLLAVYLLAIPLTANITNEYTYDGITITYSKARALAGQSVTDVYTIALKGPIKFTSEAPQITINGSAIELLQINKNGTIYYMGTVPEKPTEVNIQEMTFKKHTPLTDPPQVAYLALTIMAIAAISIVAERRGKDLIRARRIAIIGTILLAFAVFSILSTHPYTEYAFDGITFTASTTLNVVAPTTIETYTPYTAKILPMGTTITLKITASDTTIVANYYESFGYIFTVDKPYRTLWINDTTATLQHGRKYVWQLAAAYTIIFVILYVAILFAYSYFIFDVLDHEQ